MLINVTCRIIIRFTYRNISVDIMYEIYNIAKQAVVETNQEQIDTEGNGQWLENIKLLGHCKQKRNENITVVSPNFCN